jgi:hypothetical protein
MRTLAEATNGVPLEYGDELPDGSQRVTAQIDGVYRCVGRLMPSISQRTAEASPGIATWSHPRAKGGADVKLQDGGASILNFSRYWERHWQRSYPLHRDLGKRDDR